MRIGARQAADLVASHTQRLSSSVAAVALPGLSTAVIAPMVAFLIPAGLFRSLQSRSVSLAIFACHPVAYP